jgi:hypothetical protein
LLNRPKEQSPLIQTAVIELFEPCTDCEGTGKTYRPAIFYAYRPQRIVRIVPDTMPEDERAELREAGYTLVEVPATDPDHQPRKRNNEEES